MYKLSIVLMEPYSVWGIVYLLTGYAKCLSVNKRSRLHTFFILSHLLTHRSGVDTVKKTLTIMDFKIGDVVVLKSGGPEMTISEYPIKMIDGSDDYTRAQCKWFNDDHHLTNGYFRIDELEKKN